MNEPEQGIGARTMRGMAWAYTSYVGGRLLVLGATAILARLLTPSEFGTVALALTFMALLDSFTDLGLGPALVIQQENVRERADTVFIGSIVIGLCLSLILIALSSTIASFFNDPDVGPIMAALGANFFLRSLGATHYALAQKELDFRARTAAEFADVAVRGAVGVVLALSGFGAWSLVAGYLAGTVALDITIWWMVDWRPRLKLKLDHLREMLGFGTTLSGVGLVSVVIANIDYVFIAKFLGSGALGIYALGFRLPELIILNLSVVAAQVLFPAYSAIDRESLSRAFLVSMRYTVLLSMPLMTVLVILARPIILGLFGEQWTGSIEVMQILAVYAFLATTAFPAGILYKATGRAGVLLLLGLGHLAFVASLIAIFVSDGIDAVAIVQAAGWALTGIAALALAVHRFEVSPLEIWRSAWPGIAASALMALPLWGVQRLIEAPWPAIILGGVVGSVVYLGALALIAPDTLRYLHSKVRPSEPPPPLDDITVPAETERIA